MGWILTSKCGGHRAIHWDTAAGPLVLGQGPNRDVVVNDPLLGRPHCRFYIQGGRVYVESLDGSELIRVNGETVRVAAIDPGDTITLGAIAFTVTCQETAPGSDAAARMVKEALGTNDGPPPGIPPRHGRPRHPLHADNAPGAAAPPNRDLAREATGYAAAHPPNGGLASEAAGYATAFQDNAHTRNPVAPPTASPLSIVHCQLSIVSPLLGESRAMRDIRDLIRQLAPTPLSVLITGETGTGKELAAQMLHDASRRANGPFIAVNCAAIPDHLFESEIFGHEKGAFTGADRKRRGKFELAHGGTLFLDEIGDLTPENQARLLRVLEKGAYYPVGAEKESRANVRILAATNKDLQHAIHQGHFRRDLYHRLAAAEITLPPLRQLPSDIPLLAQHFSTQYAQQLGTPPKSITDDALAKLQEYPWPGNVRELKNTLQRAAALSRGNQIEAGDITLQPSIHHSQFPIHYSLSATLAEVERQHIERVIDHCGGNISAAARVLGVHRNTLHNRMAEYGIGG